MNGSPLSDLRIGIFGKGGSGKSTMTVFLARALRERGHSVLVLDADSTNVGLADALGVDHQPDHRVLVANGFEVSSVCCKSGAVPKERLGITDGRKVRPGRPEMVCNPVAQADVLESDGAELALLMGQCVGHDSATISRLGIPAVCLVAKDRVLGHNTVAALYELEDGAGQGRT